MSCVYWTNCSNIFLYLCDWVFSMTLPVNFIEAVRSSNFFRMLLIVSCLVSLFFMHMVTNGPVRSHIILASVQVLVCQMVNQLRDSGVLSNSSFPLSVYLGIIIEFIPLIHKLSIWTINHCWSWVIGFIENGWQLQKEKKVLL